MQRSASVLLPQWQPAEVRAASSRESVVVSFARRSHSRESGNLLRKPLEMRCRRTGFLPPWRDGNDRRLEWIPIPNDTKTQEPVVVQFAVAAVKGDLEEVQRY